MDFEKERREAVSAGRNALDSLREARSMLSGARGWGIYDTFFNGGVIATLVKHSKMKRAQECIDRAKSSLIRFNDEIRDLDVMGIDLHTNDLLGVADWLFDGFLSDLLMQRRIKDACTQVDALITRVSDLVDQLEKL